jgi:hypothetical protein
MKRNKYVVSKQHFGLEYRTIANMMTNDGDKMNHSTVRNIITRGFSKVIKGIAKDYDLKYDADKIKKIAQSPEFQNSIVSVMKDLNNER